MTDNPDTHSQANGKQINPCCICLQHIDYDSFTIQCEQSFTGTIKCANHTYHKSCLQAYVMNGNTCCPQDKINFTKTEMQLLLNGCFSDILINVVTPYSTSFCPYEMYTRSLQFEELMHKVSLICQHTDATLPELFTSKHIHHSKYDKTSLLELAVLQNDVQLFVIILRSTNPTVQQLDQDEDSLLHVAVRHDRDLIADILCEYSSDDPNVFNVFKKNKEGSSILDTIHLLTTTENMQRVINNYVSEHIFHTTC